MVIFNAKKEYTFGLFLNDVSISDALIEKIDAEINSQHIGNPDVPIRLNDGIEKGKSLAVVGDNDAVEMPTVKWSGSVWDMDVTPRRLNISVKASDYEAISGNEFPITAAFKRLKPHLENFSDIFESDVHRLSVVGDFKGSESENPNAVSAVADHFFNDETRSLADENELRDLQGSVNTVRELNLSAIDDPFPVHYIEKAHADWTLVNNDPTTNLLWNFDINTSPEFGYDINFDQNDIEKFYREGTDWINKKFEELVRENVRS